MDLLGFALLALTIILSSGRNILSKSISDSSFGSKGFFFTQAAIFLVGSPVPLFFAIPSLEIAPLTLLYALIYGVLLLSAQWSYTAALKSGSTGICATVYSLGFILPTLSGALFWNEKMSVWDVLGVLVVIAAVIVSGSKKKQQSGGSEKKYIFPLVIAMLSSGGLGIMQKVQQNSPYPQEKASFVFIAFVFAAVVSVVCGLFAKSDSVKLSPKNFAFAGGVGICFGCCNIINTTLAGMLDSALLFPTLNIGTILLSVVTGTLIFKEKLEKKDFCVFIMGILSILLLNL